MKKYNNLINNKKGGATGFILLFIIITLSIVIYFGYQKYHERYYINIYDNETLDRTIEIPPFAERLTDSNKELIGECDLQIKTSLQQVIEFYKSYSSRCGFSFGVLPNGFIITLRKDFELEAKINDTTLQMRWIPVLDAKKVRKAIKLYGDVKRKPAKEEIGY